MSHRNQSRIEHNYQTNSCNRYTYVVGRVLATDLNELALFKHKVIFDLRWVKIMLVSKAIS